MEPSSNTSSLAIPISIVFGFALIAAAIYFSGFGSSPKVTTTDTTAKDQPTTKAVIRPVDETDYIRGNPNAPILIVEYSDYDCPFCKSFHETMTQIMNEYGVTGKIAWVYRNFPITQLHPNAARIAEAALCVGELSGNDAYWKFSDLIFQERNINEQTNISRLPEYAEKSGVDKTEFMSCLESGRQKDNVSKSYQEGVAAGIQGTPNSFVLVGNQQAEINGAQPYEVVKQIVENLLGQLDGAEVKQ